MSTTTIPRKKTQAARPTSPTAATSAAGAVIKAAAGAPGTSASSAVMKTAAGAASVDQAAGSTDAGNGARKAHAVDPAVKTAALKRLRRIEGQIRGLQRMVEDQRYCADIVVQVASVQEALRAVSRELMRNHLRHCATHALGGDEPQRAAMLDELLDLMYRHAR